MEKDDDPRTSSNKRIEIRIEDMEMPEKFDWDEIVTNLKLL